MSPEAFLRIGKGRLIRVESGAQGSSGFPSWPAPPLAEMLQIVCGVTRRRSFGKGAPGKCPPVIVGPAEPDFSPCLRMGWLESRDRAESLDVGRLQGEEMPRHARKHPGLPAVDRLEMTEEQRHPHQVKRSQLVFQSPERTGHTMSDALLCQKLLKLVNICFQLLDLTVLLFRDPPDKKKNATPILGENSCHRFTQKDIRSIGDLKTSFNRIIIRERHKIHPGAA